MLPPERLIHDDDALPLIEAWVRDAPFPVELLSRKHRDGEAALVTLQVSTRSTLGALAYWTGGLLVDHGWLRMLGAGCSRFAHSLHGWNDVVDVAEGRASALTIAHDAIGGFYRIDPGTRTVHYGSPGNAEWQDLEIGHTDWVSAALTDSLTEFYADLRWDEWEDDVGALPPERALHFAPPLWARADEGRSRRDVPVAELWPG